MEEKHSTSPPASASLDYIQSELDNPIYAAGNPRITSNLKPSGWGASPHRWLKYLKKEYMKIEDIKEHLAHLEHINDSAYTVSLQTKTPIDKERCMTTLAKLSKAFPHLSESKIEEDSGEFVLKSLKRKIEEQEFLRLTNYRTFTYAFGSKVVFDSSDFSKRFFQTIQDTLDLNSLSIDYIDLQIHSEAVFAQDHYALIFDCFFSDSTVNLFERHKCVQNDFVVKGFIDESRLAVVTVTTEQAMEESLLGEFDEKILKFQCGIGHIRNLNRVENLSDTFEEHYKICSEFIKSRFVPNILEPANAKIKK
jgi:hypothetical protein